MMALAERYLRKPTCARMEGIEERVERMKDMAADAKADGVICSTVKFCDTYLYDVPTMHARCEAAGIPFLFLEHDYAWTGLEQMKTRVEAFLTVTAGRRSA
jgi:benzoyl-CoA reductase/2-hydroxyglutaryl-CoA dehydratase subunit BcrC/BadD/HgdB